jgi:hypothetical protein
MMLVFAKHGELGPTLRRDPRLDPSTHFALLLLLLVLL